MDKTKLTAAYYIKTSLLSLALFAESFFLTKTISNYVSAQNFISANFEFMGTSATLLLAILITNALISGAWGKITQYFLTPIFITAGIAVVVFPINSAYAAVIGSLVLMLLFFDTFQASQLRDQMTRFNPRLILKLASKGLVLSFSLTATILVLISSDKQPELRIGESVGTFVENKFAPQINEQISKNMQESLPQDQLEKLNSLGLKPAELSYINSSPLIEKLGSFTGASTSNFSIKNGVTNEVNKLIEPYRKFLNPIMALLVFGLMQLIGIITFFVYTLIIDLIFLIAKKTGFFKIRTETVEKEILSF